MTTNPQADRAALSLRMPAEQYDMLKALAYLSRTPMNKIINRVLADFLDGPGRQELLAASLKDTQEKYRNTLDMLKEL